MKMKYMPVMGQGFDHPEIALSDIPNHYFPTISGLISTHKTGSVGAWGMHKARLVCRWIKSLVTAHAGQSFGFLRCSALSLRPQASSTHDEKLALGLSAFSCSTLESMLSSTSCGKRMFLSCDLLFLFPVATGNPVIGCFYVYTHYMSVKPKKRIDLSTHHELMCLYTLSVGKEQEISEIAKPGSATTLTGPLTKPLTGITNMAGSQHTQTHPKFTWRFLALGAISRSVIHIIATTEREARDQSPAGCVIVFAGRLPVKAVCHGA